MSLEDFFRETDVNDISILSSNEDRIYLPEGTSSFQSELGRDGPDLILTGRDGASVRIVDYFDGSPADLVGANGGVMPGAVATRLAGPEAAGLYAQTGGGTNDLLIGQVETLDGVVTAQRADGTVVTLQIGSKVFEDDVIQTEAGATASLTFVDGTIFTMSAQSRMILDALIYDPDGSDNSAAFNLIEGGFVFIAGQVAGTGGMDVTTPTATMGIRGTTVSVDIQTEDGITTVQISLNVDPDGGIGKIELRDLEGNLLSTIESTDVSWIVSPRDGETREISRVLTDDAPEFQLLSEAIAAFRSAVSRVEEGGTFVELDTVGADTQDEDTPDPDGTEIGEFETEVEDLNDQEPLLPPVDPLESQEDPSPTEPVLDDTVVETDTNTAPDADDVRVNGQEDSLIEGRVIGTDADGDAVSYAIGTAPGNGAVTIRADGSFDYTPNADFNGVDRFTVVLTDTNGDSSVSEVLVDVQAVNDAPNLDDAGLTIQEDGSLTDRLVATDPDGETPAVRLASGAGNGTVVLLSNGTFTYTPDADFNGVDSFLVDAVDALGETTRAKVQVTITAVDDAPEVAGDTTAAFTDTGGAGGSVMGTVTAIDPDAGASATWVGSTTGTYGTFSIDANSGAWVYTLFGTPTTVPAANGTAIAARGSSIQNLRAGETATETFTVTATDNTGETGSKDIEITLTGINDIPVIVGTATGSATDTGSAGVTATGTLLAFDPDTDATATWSGGSNGTYGSLAINTSTGQWTYTLDDTDADTRGLKAGETATDQFTVTATDDKGATDAQIVTITITGSNDVPTVTQITLGTVQETSDPVVLDLLAGQSDIDGDSLTATGIQVTDDLGATVTFTTATDGKITIDPDQFASLNTGEQRTVTVTYNVTDGTASTQNTATFVVEGITPNTVPSANDDVLKPSASKILVITTNADEAQNGKAGLDALSRFDQIDMLGQTTGLTAAVLAGYDAVLTFSNKAYDNADDYGDLLANFITNGGGVVAATYSFSDGTVKSGSLPDGTIGGDFVPLSPFIGTTTLGLPVGDLRSLVDSDDIWDGVDIASLTGSFTTNDNYALTTLQTGATLLARYGTGVDGMLGIARNADGTVIGANIFPGNTDAAETVFWTLFANMLDNVASRNLPEFHENTTTTILAERLLANDSDGDSDTLTITGVAATSAKGATLSLVDGNIVYDPANSAVIDALDDGETLTDTFTYTVSDGKGGSTTATVSLTVGGADETLQDMVNLGVLDLTNGTPDTVSLTLADVLDLPETDNTELEGLMNPLDIPATGEDIMIILGDAQDQIQLEGVPTKLPDQVTLTDGSVLDLYSYSDASTGDVLSVIGIEDDVTVYLLGATS